MQETCESGEQKSCLYKGFDVEVRMRRQHTPSPFSSFPVARHRRVSHHQDSVSRLGNKSAPIESRHVSRGRQLQEPISGRGFSVIGADDRESGTRQIRGHIQSLSDNCSPLSPAEEIVSNAHLPLPTSSCPPFGQTLEPQKVCTFLPRVYSESRFMFMA